MTDEELDILFTKTIKEVLEDIKECAEYTKNLHTPEYEEINEDYQDSINQLEFIIKNCKTIDDLSEMDEDVIDATYEYIASYADNFIISSQEPQRTENLHQYSQLEELLDLFLDDDYDEEEEI